MNSCVDISCCCCIFFVQLVTSFLFFFLCSHRFDPWVHSHLQSSARASTSFRFCFVPILSQCKSGPLMRSRHRQHKYCSSHLFLVTDSRYIWQFLNLSKIDLYPFFLPGCIVSCEINSLPLSWSVSCFVRKSLLY